MSNQKTDFINRFMQTEIHITPVVILVDTSMSVENIKNELNITLTSMLDQLKQSDIFKETIRLLVVHFNSESKVVVDFTPLEEVNASDITINEKCFGCTDTGKAISTALNMVYEYREKIYDESDGYIIPNQPLVFLLTDSIPDVGKKRREDTDEEYQEAVNAVNQAYAQAAEYIKEKEKNKKIFFIAVGIKHYHSTITEDKLKELTNFPDNIYLANNEITDFDKLGRVLVNKSFRMCNIGLLDDYIFFPETNDFVIF